MVRLLPLLLVACATHPIQGKWRGDDLPLQISADASVLIRAEANFTNLVRISATARTTTDIELATIELVGAFAVDTSKDPQVLIVEIDSISVRTIAGELVSVDEKNQADSGRFLCFPLNNVEACIERTQRLAFAIDGDTLRFFFDVGGVTLATPFTRVR